MLFDLQGKRRRVVQATYLTLAVLMGGGLVLFGIGSGASGGLFDAISGGGGGSGNEVVEDRIDDNEDKVAANPKAEQARKDLVRDYYSLATGQASADGTFPAEAREDLRKASRHWTLYLQNETGKPDASLARLAVQLFDPAALNQPAKAVRAARIVAADSNDPAGYAQVVQYALLAGDKRTERLATIKAIDLAPKGQRASVRKQLKQIKAAAVASQLQQQGNIQVDPNQKQGQGTKTEKQGAK